MMTDPLFKKTTKRFDDMRASTLLTANLSTTSNLLLQFDSKVGEKDDAEERRGDRSSFINMTK
jgi:hypothetical protein